MLPTPGAAGFVAALVNFMPRVQQGPMLQIFGTLIMALLAYLMVSRIEFFSIKSLKLSGMRLFARIALGAVIALIWYNSAVGFLVLAGGYVLSGPYKWLRSRSGTGKPAAKSDDKMVEIAQ